MTFGNASIYDKTLSVAVRRNDSLVLSTAIEVMVIPRLSAVKVTLVPHVTTTKISKLITRNIRFMILKILIVRPIFLMSGQFVLGGLNYYIQFGRKQRFYFNVK